MMPNAIQRRQILVFVVGWLAYASTYLLRKSLGVVKGDMETELHFSKSQLGWFDTALLLPYALMQMVLGPIGDKLGARRTFGSCLVLSALSMATFGLWSNFGVFVFLLLMNGTAQSQCWPNCIKALSAWYPDKTRNSVMGAFGTCAFAGGIAGTTLSVYLQTVHGWRAAFLIPSLIVAAFGVMVLLLYHSPEESEIVVPGKDITSPGLSSSRSTQLGFLQLWKIPLVAEVAIGVFCLKVVRYCMYMWLPLYFLRHLKYTKTQAGMFSTMFEIGGVAGSALIGFVIDRFFNGKGLFGSTISMLLSTAALVAFSITSSWGIVVNSIFMLLAGAFNCGPDSILGGSIPSELGEMEGRNAAAAVVGLVNGFGSVGTFLEGPIIGLVSEHYGWGGMFYLMIGTSLVGTLSIYWASRKQSNIYQKLPLADTDFA